MSLITWSRSLVTLKYWSNISTSPVIRNITRSGRNCKFDSKYRLTKFYSTEIVMEKHDNAAVSGVKKNTLNISPEDVQRLKEAATLAIDEAASELNGLSQELWKNPELSFEEYKAHKLLTDFLERHGFSVDRSFHFETAFRARYHADGIVKPNIAVLCEYDALPGIGHACGHNLIAEVGVGAGLGVQAALQKCGLPIGQLTVLGCPAEEQGGGKICLINSGAFSDCDAALMSHPSNFSGVEAPFAALQEVKVLYRGVSSHAACEPHSGINALDAAIMAYNAVSCLRQQMKPCCRVHGIISKGGTTPNIIPEEAELFYYIRAQTNSELDKLVARVTACFEAAAVATGCTVEYTWDPHRYKDMISNKTMGELYVKNAAKFGVEFTSEDEMPTYFGSTDMGNVSYVVPSIHPHFYLGAKHPEHSRPFADAAGGADAQSYATREAKLLAHTVIDLLCQPELLRLAQSEFGQDLIRRGVPGTSE